MFTSLITESPLAIHLREKTILFDVLCEQCDHHLDALVGPLLVVILGSLDRVKQTVSVVWNT